MLLHPHDAFGFRDLSLENGWLWAFFVQYFMCSNCRGANGWLLSSFAGTNCNKCGLLMNQTPKVVVDCNEIAEKNNLRTDFVKGEPTYLIFDDLKVMHSSPSNFIPLLVQLGYTDFNKLTKMSLNIGSKEMIDLLRQSLISKSPLTDVFLKNGESKPMDSSCLRPEAVKMESQSYKIKVRIITSKPKNKILYAEAEDDFIDFLFSFLTMPLGSIPKLLNENSCMGCMDKLYQSVKNMNPSCYTKLCNLILNPGVAPQFGVNNQPLPIPEHNPPKYWCSPGGVSIDNNSRYRTSVGVISRPPSLIQDLVAMKLYEPRCDDDGKKKEEAVGFVGRPIVFAVWDDLQMTPLTCTSTSTISFLKKLNVPLDDLEEHVVSIGETEALQLLRASLTSRAALTEGLCFLLKKPVPVPIPEEVIPLVWKQP